MKKLIAVSLLFSGCAVLGAAVGACRLQEAVVPVAPNALLTQGRMVAALLREKKGVALWERFAPGMAQALPRDKAAVFVNDLPTFGEPRDEWAADNTYLARLTAPDGSEFLLTVVFAGEKIAGFTVLPTPALTDNVRSAVRSAGRLAVSQIAEKKGDALHARFTPSFAAKVSEAQMRDLLNKAVPVPRSGVTPLADAVAEGTDDGMWVYQAVFAASEAQNVAITIAFLDGAAMKIAGCVIRVVPTAALPPDPHAGYQTKAVLHLPFSPGVDWTVLWGGDTREQNYHVDSPDQRHAYDFLIVKNDATHTGDGSENAQYFAWDKPLLAPANATVLATQNDLEDNKPGVMRPEAAFGNYVLLDFGQGEYGMLAHLRRGTVAVRVGQVVRTNDLLGRCGNSGNSSQAHLHFHLQDSPRPFDARGLPAAFTAYRADGKKVASGCPVMGKVVVAP